MVLGSFEGFKLFKIIVRKRVRSDTVELVLLQLICHCKLSTHCDSCTVYTDGAWNMVVIARQPRPSNKMYEKIYVVSLFGL